MDANQTCEILMSYIKKSNLNWSITESPFSVSITLKKSFIKKKDGSLCESGLDPIISPNKQEKSSNLEKPSSMQLQQPMINTYSTKNTKLHEPTKINISNNNNILSTNLKHEAMERTPCGP